MAIKNIGAGIAYDMKISSSQPQIIDNEKGLLVDFRILGSTLGAEERDTTLEVRCKL